MLPPDDVRKRLHELIDMIPDEQIGLVWMALQGMISPVDDDDYDEDEIDDPDIDRV